MMKTKIQRLLDEIESEYKLNAIFFLSMITIKV